MLEIRFCNKNGDIRKNNCDICKKNGDICKNDGDICKKNGDNFFVTKTVTKNFEVKIEAGCRDPRTIESV